MMHHKIHRTNVAALFVLCFAATSSFSDEVNAIPSWASGRYEIFVFSDYFCPPCQTLNSQLEPVLEEIVAQGGAKVQFVDVPIHRPTILYNRFYLYAVHANADIKNILKARKALYDFARTSPDAHRATEKTLSELFRKERIAYKPFDVKPVQKELEKNIKQYKIDSTPTCIIKSSGNEIKEYGSVQEILDKLIKFKKQVKGNTLSIKD